MLGEQSEAPAKFVETRPFFVWKGTEACFHGPVRSVRTNLQTYSGHREFR